ncbi:probable protein phosphatase 2C 52 [Amaranthus tricolor]|uniref:probable protein phosphatase 2C 52 n=1 Tax=Amaranthus tricolor TaxID=29722 RepID=UPI0025908CB7|nr:probable protein phosphatase 2C 52 [Amaranthus tricolor]
MGGCISTSSQSTCSSRSNGETMQSSCCLGMRLCGWKRNKRTFSDHIATLQHLSSIPNRIVMNGKSRSSCIFTQQGRKGINQDAMIAWEDFMIDDVIFCGVFDGHGPHGHLVSRRVRDTLPLKILSLLNSSPAKEGGSSGTFGNGDLQSEAATAEKNDSSEDNISSLWRDVFLKSYKAMDKELRSHPNLDCFCSGSTAVSIVKQGSNLFMGSIGDSRAIMGSMDSNDTLIAIQLTVDQKPDLPREAERIKQCKGRVFALQDEPEVSRVWLPFDDAPGLAMARAFGDFCLKEYGVISVPEFSHRTLTDKDLFIVLASDGVWDVLSNEEVVEIISTSPSRASAARVLVESAAREWKLKYPTSKMDDCAVVCLFLDGKMDSESDYDEQCFSSVTIQSNISGGPMESEDGQHSEPSFQRNITVRATEENDSFRRLPVEVLTVGSILAEDENWSGLEGVTRVNSLVQLPRFSEERPNSGPIG